MDNRIPKVIKDFVTPKKVENDEIDGYSYLSFEDWINEKDYLKSDWILIAKIDDSKKNEDLTTISCFVSPPDEKSKKILFKRNDWEINSEFGIPYIDGNLNNEWDFEKSLKYKIKGITLKPFVIRRDFHSYIPSRFELIQHFLLYYKAFWVEEKQEFQTIEANGDVNAIVKHNTKNEDFEEIYVNTIYLRNYLALTKSYLIRFHDHRRKFEKQMPFESKDASFKNDDCSYNIEVYNESFMEGFKSYSRLLGKDIIKPFEKPTLNFTFEKLETDYENFIYDISENGKNIEFSCNKKLLSSYFKDTGAPNFLTPIYFNKSVLLKYYSEPKKYTVSSHRFTCLNLWGIDLDITAENLVQVWLGDLSSLPKNEQLHWKQYNVPPRGKISNHRFERDFEAKFSSPTVEQSPIAYLMLVYDELNSSINSEFSANLFLELTKNDLHYLKILRIPLTEEWKEFDEQIQVLAKIFCDSLNVKLLEKISDKKIDNKEIKGSISLLYVTLEKIGIEKEEINLTIEALQAIQSIRSTGSAHRKGEKFEQSLEKYKLNNLSNENKIKELTVKLYNGLNAINKKLNSKQID
ncbi:hypothetical protein [Flavobacterium sp. ZE23DGlu08]|jgi:hypothetical protein|uniref:hypothetical protein n=1 Tax=Flavobacterium sp. ZE23DGlu08 TaxID=3059026 RepID=UPI00265FDE78|nr:hypothetical protein [Flavobacterium sp. ZE23DGlu08]WKL44547.1 hypothetical protein Q1W72_02720 [Flavobacterium sp. ZE23DGlu08]